jgi:hypothetical protein
VRYEVLQRGPAENASLLGLYVLSVGKQQYLKGTKSLQNISNCLPTDTAYHPRTPEPFSREKFPH